MNNKGKKLQVLFEPALRINSVTGEKEITEFGCVIWTDKNLNQLIARIPGVVHVENVYYPEQYSVTFDPRYDPEFVKKEIEAAIILELGEI